MRIYEVVTSSGETVRYIAERYARARFDVDGVELWETDEPADSGGTGPQVLWFRRLLEERVVGAVGSGPRLEIAVS